MAGKEERRLSEGHSWHRPLSHEGDEKSEDFSRLLTDLVSEVKRGSQTWR